MVLNDKRTFMFTVITWPSPNETVTEEAGMKQGAINTDVTEMVSVNVALAPAVSVAVITRIQILKKLNQRKSIQKYAN